MACVDTLPGTTATTTASESERVRYFPRQLLTADDMRIEQQYFREKQRRHNRFLHGWGVVCGLEVKADPDSGPLAIQICPGYALGPCGDEIYVPDPVPFDLGDCIRRPASPCNPKNSVADAEAAGPAIAFPGLKLATAIIVSIRYTECPTRPLRTLPAGCGCDDTACEYSRIRDGYDIRCREGLTTKKKDSAPTICELEGRKGRAIQPFPDPPADVWVDLAAISLTKETDNASTLGANAIDNGVRRMVYSSAMIQQQLIACCCQTKKTEFVPDVKE